LTGRPCQGYIFKSPDLFSKIKTGRKGCGRENCPILFEDLEVVMHSPSNGIRVLGSVCYQSGAGVAGAAVVITDVQRGTTRAVATDDSGNYVAAQLQPGVYKVR